MPSDVKGTVAGVSRNQPTGIYLGSLYGVNWGTLANECKHQPEATSAVNNAVATPFVVTVSDGNVVHGIDQAALTGQPLDQTKDSTRLCRMEEVTRLPHDGRNGACV